MKTSIRTTVVSLLAAVALITSTSVAFAQETKTLKEALKDKFLIGTAVNTRQASGRDKAGVRVIQEQFNAIVAENCMKSQEMHPKENRYNKALHPDRPRVHIEKPMGYILHLEFHKT